MKHLPGSFRLTLLITAVAAVLLLPLQLHAGELAHIVLKDGTVFESVDFKADYRYVVIEFKVGSDTKYVSFTDIHAIIDLSGNDITARVIRGYSTTAGSETWQSVTSEVHQEARRRLWCMGFAAGGNLFFPSGDQYRGVDHGTGFYGEVLYALTRSLALKAAVSSSSLTTDNDYVLQVNEGSSSSYTVHNYEISSWKYFLIAQYYILPDNISTGGFIPYFFNGIGIVREETEADQTFLDDSSEEEYTRRLSDTDTNLSLTLGIGIVYLMNRTFGICAEVDVFQISQYARPYPGSDDYEYSFGGQFGISIGLIALL